MEEELQLDLPLLEELLHLSLGLIQLLKDALDVVDGAVVWCFVAGDGRVPGTIIIIKKEYSRLGNNLHSSYVQL